MTISLNPNTFVEGGLIDDVDAEFIEVQFCGYDYNGTVEAVLALGIKMRCTVDNQQKDYDQYYSAGDLANFAPSPDGYSLEPVSGKTALNSNSNAAKFLMSLQAAGAGALDEILNSGSVQGLVGLKCHMNRVAQPKRSGIVRTGKNADREQTILLVTKIIAMPGQAVASPVKALGAKVGQGLPAAKPAAKVGMGGVAGAASKPVVPAGTNGAATPNADVDSLAAETLIGLLAAAGGAMAKKDLPPATFRALAGNPLKTKVVSRIFEDAFLSSVDGITYDGSTVTMT